MWRGRQRWQDALHYGQHQCLYRIKLKVLERNPKSLFAFGYTILAIKMV